MDDVRAVMDAAESERAVVFGVSEGGPMAMLFAATYPERAIALVLYGTDSRLHGYGVGRSFVSEGDRYLEYIDEHWGTIEHARMEIASWGAPSHADDEGLATWPPRTSGGCEPGGCDRAREDEFRQIDVSHALPAIHVPTLLIAKTEDVEFPVTRMRWLTSQIAGEQRPWSRWLCQRHRPWPSGPSTPTTLSPR